MSRYYGAASIAFAAESADYGSAVLAKMNFHVDFPLAGDIKNGAGHGGKPQYPG